MTAGLVDGKRPGRLASPGYANGGKTSVPGLRFGVAAAGREMHGVSPGLRATSDGLPGVEGRLLRYGKYLPGQRQ